MITVDVKDYCENCENFKPVLEQYYLNNTTFVNRIHCSSGRHCDELVRHLKWELKKLEKKEEEWK